MRIAALSNKDAWFSRLVEEMGKHRLDGQVLRGVPTEDTVVVDTAVLEHEGPDTCYRPYIALTGRVLSSRPAVQLPYGVDELTFASAPGTPVAYRYDLTDEQISRLVLSKGLHSGAFTVPAELTGIEWQLPGAIDVFVAAPASFDDPPVVFIELQEQTSRRIDEATSGYELVEYMPDVEAGLDNQVERVSDGPERGVLDRDLFAEDELPEYSDQSVREPASQQGEPDREQDVEADGKSAFDRLLEDASQRLQAKAEEERAAEAARRDAIRAEVDPDGPEGLYQSRIAPSIEAAFDEDDKPQELGQRRRARDRVAQVANEEATKAATEGDFIAFD